jgi:hypothetical protein
MKSVKSLEKSGLVKMAKTDKKINDVVGGVSWKALSEGATRCHPSIGSTISSWPSRLGYFFKSIYDSI